MRGVLRKVLMLSEIEELYDTVKYASIFFVEILLIRKIIFLITHNLGTNVSLNIII